MATNESVLPSEKSKDIEQTSESKLIDLKNDGRESLQPGSNDEKKEPKKNEVPMSESQEIEGELEDRHQVAKPCETTKESLSEVKADNIKPSVQNIESKCSVEESEITEHLKLTKEKVEVEKTENVAGILDSTPSAISESKDIDNVVDRPVESSLLETSTSESGSKIGSAIEQKSIPVAFSAESLTKTSAEPILETHKEAASEPNDKAKESKSEGSEKRVEDACKKSAFLTESDVETQKESSQMESETEHTINQTHHSAKEKEKDGDLQSDMREENKFLTVQNVAVPSVDLSRDKLESAPVSKPISELRTDKLENVLLSKAEAEFSTNKPESAPVSKTVAEMESETDKVESDYVTITPASTSEVSEKSEKSDVKLTEEIHPTKKDESEKEVANFPMSKFSRSSTFEDTEEKMEVEEVPEQNITEEIKPDAKPLENFQLKHDRVENLKNDPNSKSVPSPVSVDTSEDSQFSTDIPASPGTTKPTVNKPSFVAAFKETAMDVEGDNSMDVPMFDTPLGTPISMLADESIDNPDTRASVASNDVSGPTPTKKPRMGSLISARKEFVKLVITVDKLYEYQWPQGEGEWHMLQEQVSEYLSIKSFKRKYPDMYRRFVDKEEKEFLMDRGVVTETHCDLGLTAVRSEDIYDLMYKDYPEKYEEFLTYMHGKQRETIYEQHKEYDVPNVEKSKLAEYMKKAVKSAAEFNSQMQKERREERKAFFDLQTFSVHYPVNRYKKLPPELTKASAYPIALIPGQFQDHYTTYTADELKYLPINTAMYDAPKWMESEQPKETNQTSEVEDSQGEKTASSDGDSDSGSESGSDSGDEKEEKEKEKPVKAEPVKETTCRRCEIKNKNKKRIRRIKEEIINCSECGAGGHPTCLELTEEMVGVIQTYPWQCMECKTCVECMDPYDEDKMMFCDRCDRGYHTFCVGMKAIPTGRWECKSCKGTTASITETPKSKKGK